MRAHPGPADPGDPPARPFGILRAAAQGHGVPVFTGIDDALHEPDTALRLFGKPRVQGQRRVGVTLARAADIDSARRIARDAAAAITVELSGP